VLVRFETVRHETPVRLWLLLTVQGNEVCVADPGFEEDGVVAGDPAALVRWYAGEITLAAAELHGDARVSAPPWLERELARWGRLSPFAAVGPALAAT
jgi:hypothetical protein